MDVVKLSQRYKDSPVSDRPCYSRSDRVALEGVVPREWRDAVVDDKGRVERIPYELCGLKTLREAIHRARFGWSGRTGGTTPTTTYRPILRTTETCTTPPCVPLWMAVSSSRTSSSGWSPR
jgi:hypothetical protein